MLLPFPSLTGQGATEHRYLDTQSPCCPRQARTTALCGLLARLVAGGPEVGGCTAHGAGLSLRQWPCLRRLVCVVPSRHAAAHQGPCCFVPLTYLRTTSPASCPSPPRPASQLESRHAVALAKALLAARDRLLWPSLARLANPLLRPQVRLARTGQPGSYATWQLGSQPRKSGAARRLCGHRCSGHERFRTLGCKPLPPATPRPAPPPSRTRCHACQV